MICIYGQQFRHHSRAGDFDEDNMVQSSTIERIEHGKLPLNFMRLDHAFQDIAHSQGLALARKMVGNGEDGPQIIGGMPPFRCEEAVVEV